MTSGWVCCPSNWNNRDGQRHKAGNHSVSTVQWARSGCNMHTPGTNCATALDSPSGSTYPPLQVTGSQQYNSTAEFHVFSTQRLLSRTWSPIPLRRTGQELVWGDQYHLYC
jgi:hypothetical protein